MNDTSATGDWACRWCASRAGDVVVDLGCQPSPALVWPSDPLPDPQGPLRLVRCAVCGLAQLEESLAGYEELASVESAEMTGQATEAVEALSAAGLVGPGVTYIEFASPHGGSWAEPLAARGASPHDGGGEVELVLDVFGLMHEPDLGRALRGRVARLGPGGTLVVQIHPVGVDVARGAWHAVRHGHYSYLTVHGVVAMCAELGLTALEGWSFPLQGGTVMLAFGRLPDGSTRSSSRAIAALMEREREGGSTELEGLSQLASATGTASDLRDWLVAAADEGHEVVGYAAASGVPALLALAGVDATLLPRIADASPAKLGRAMPGSRIPIVSPEAALVAGRASRVLVFVSGLVAELRSTYPEIERAGGRWVVADPGIAEVEPGRMLGDPSGTIFGRHTRGGGQR